MLLLTPLTVFAEQLIPAGSLISCIVSEPKLSSKTENIGDPVMCKVSHVELYGRSTLPYGSYLVGRFEDYKDPGHFVGKGWMELKFDRMVIQPDTVIPVDARVVAAPGYVVDRYGRILGKGHPVRDVIEWSIPILWPIDLLNLPRRGPRPTLKEETRLTLKIMDDLGVPERQPYTNDSPQLLRRPSAYQPQDYQPPQPAPQAYAPPPVYQQQPVVQTYVQPMYVAAPPVYYVMPPPMPVYYYPPPVMVQAPSPYMGAYYGTAYYGRY
ncbi:MAG TPA: hypothetical protein VHT28_10640 [Silvibacterium sp.]|jgi:hypothetical protein|nr:hypothetical protein [Silvibacterium sp.]